MSGTATSPVSAQRSKFPGKTNGMAAQTRAEPPCTSGSRSNKPCPALGKSSLAMSQSLNQADAQPRHQPSSANPSTIGSRSKVNATSHPLCATPPDHRLDYHDVTAAWALPCNLVCTDSRESHTVHGGQRMELWLL